MNFDCIISAILNNPKRSILLEVRAWTNILEAKHCGLQIGRMNAIVRKSLSLLGPITSTINRISCKYPMYTISWLTVSLRSLIQIQSKVCTKAKRKKEEEEKHKAVLFCKPVFLLKNASSKEPLINVSWFMAVGGVENLSLCILSIQLFTL